MTVRTTTLAVAQAQEQATATYTESLNAVCGLLKVGIYHTANLRGLFPESSFKDMAMDQLEEGLTVKVLSVETADPEARAMMTWVEEGVLDAVKKGYVDTCTFGLSTDKEGRELLEEYVYRFSYSNSEVSLDLGGGGKRAAKSLSNPAKQKGSAAPVTAAGMKYKITRLIRMLVSLCQTLEKVPAERHLFMKLTYYPHTPEDYEPPSFVPAGDRAVGYFARKPFSMLAGGVEAGYHTVSLRVKSVLDSVDAGAEAGGMVADDAADENSTHLSGDCGDSDGEEPSVMGSLAEDASPGKKHYQPDLHELYTQMPEDLAASADPDLASSAAMDPALLGGVRAWALTRKRGEVNLLDAMTRFYEVAVPTLKAALLSMVEDGTLIQTAEKDHFRVVAAPTPAASAGHQASGQDVAQHMRALDLGAGSLVGGLHQVPGSQVTVSVGAGLRTEGHLDSQQQQTGQVAAPWFDSQQSDMALRRTRKTSIVETLIYQNKRQRRAAPDAAAPAKQGAGPQTRQRRGKSNLRK